MKQLLKSLLGLFYCKLYGVKYAKNLYVGIGAKLVGGGHSSFSQCKYYASSHVGFFRRKN